MSQGDFYDRMPPSDLDAEICVLAAMMLDGESCARLLAMLTRDSFLLPDHQYLYDAILNLHGAGTKIDSVMVVHELRRAGTYEKMGGKDYLARILGSVPSAAHGEQYARIVRDHHRRRWVHKAALAAAHQAYKHDSDPIKIASELRQQFSQLIRRASVGLDRDGGSKELAGLIHETESGQRRSIDFPHPILSRLTKALLPATITLVCGTPGDGKTFLMLSMLMDLLGRGVEAAIFMLEGDRKYHLARCLGLLAGDCRLLDDEAIRNGNGWAKEISDQHAESIEVVGRSIFDSTREECTLEALGRWVERESKNHRILIIDPITLAEAGKDRYTADEAFMRIARDAITETGTSLIIVTHPKTQKGRHGPPSLDDLAGGAVYPRAAETVLALRKHDEPKQYRMIDKNGCEAHGRANRELRILKARNGRGGGHHLAMDFHGATLQFNELGIIQEEEESQV